MMTITKYRCYLYLVFFYFICSSFAKSQNGNWFFNAPIIHEININFYEPNYWDSLTYYKTIDDQSGIENYLAALITIDSITLDSVGVRLRGNSSYNHPGTKKPIQLDFNEFISGQKLDGLKKLNLNNSYLDPTQLREKLFLDILNNWGVPASRCTYAKVYFNGAYIGLYKAIETINKDFLEHHFSNKDGNLFKCEPDMPLKWEGYNQNDYYDNCELKTNETLNDWSDLIDLINRIANSSIANFENNVSSKFEINEYMRSYAANVVFGNLDSYVFLPHNYYLYHNTNSDKFEWITWDVSLAFGVYVTLLFPNSIDFDMDYLPSAASINRPLNYFIQNTSLKNYYRNSVCELMSTYFNPNYLYPKIDSIATVIRTAVYAEPSYNQMFTTNQFEGNLGTQQVNQGLIVQIPGLKRYVSERRKNLAKQICDKNWSCAKGSLIASGDDFLQLYPNPANTTLNIELGASDETNSTAIRVYDMSGHLIQEINPYLNPGNPIYQMHVAYLSNGIYAVSTKTTCKETSKKFIVIHD